MLLALAIVGGCLIYGMGAALTYVGFYGQGVRKFSSEDVMGGPNKFFFAVLFWPVGMWAVFALMLIDRLRAKQEEQLKLEAEMKRVLQKEGLGA